MQHLVPALTAMLALSACAPDRLRKADYDLIRGRTFVVTGASSGFGRGVAEELGRNGGNVVLAARRAEVLEEVARTIGASGGTALVVPTDVADPAQMERLGDAAVARFGRIDSWINNAGVGAIGPFEAIPLADHARVVDVNLTGVINGSHVALNQFKRQGHGVLVNISSLEGKVPLAWHSSYAASKHGVLGLGNAIHQELRLTRHLGPIRVATVLPWASDTPYWTHSANYSGRAARMVMLDPPKMVVDAIVMAAVKPRKKVAVGLKAKAAYAGHNIAPGIAEHVGANIIHDAQMVDAPPGPVTPGNLHRPMPQGTAIDGGLSERMKAQEGTPRPREAGPAPR